MKIKLGKYRHYKGNLYEVIDCARHSETEEWFVVYKTCYGDYSTWIRPYDMFTEQVDVDGQLIPRFTFEVEKPSKRLNSGMQTTAKQPSSSDDILQALNDSVHE